MNEQLDLNFMSATTTTFPPISGGYVDITGGVNNSGYLQWPTYYDAVTAAENVKLKVELESVKRNIESLLDIIKYLTK